MARKATPARKARREKLAKALAFLARLALMVRREPKDFKAAKALLGLQARMGRRDLMVRLAPKA